MWKCWENGARNNNVEKLKEENEFLKEEAEENKNLFDESPVRLALKYLGLPVPVAAGSGAATVPPQKKKNNHNK